MFSAAVTRLATAITVNGDSGGMLTSLNLLGNRMKSCIHRPPNDFTDNWLQQCGCDQCGSSSSVRDLIAARAGHPHLISLSGVQPGDTYLTIPNNKADALVARIVASELAYNHVVEHVDLTNNRIEAGGIGALVASIHSNVCLKSLALPRELPASAPKEVQLKFEDMMLKFEEAKLRSFQFRVALAIFIRGYYYLGHSPLRTILEYLIGRGPKVLRYLFYRDVSYSREERPQSGRVNAAPFAGIHSPVKYWHDDGVNDDNVSVTESGILGISAADDSDGAMMEG
jgi:hypothetical protein